MTGGTEHTPGGRSFTPVALAVLIVASAIAPLATTTYLPASPRLPPT